MATKAPGKLRAGLDLDALTAQKVFGWRNAYMIDERKKQIVRGGV